MEWTETIPPAEALESDLDVVHRDWPKDRQPQTFIDPQLGRAPRRFMRNPLQPSTTLGSATGREFLVTPEGVLRILHWGVLVYTATATVGARNVVLRCDEDEGANTGWLFNGTGTVAPTATQTGQIAIGPSVTGANIGGNTGTFRTIQSPIRLPDGHGLGVQDLANIDTADTFVFRGQVEEFTLPRGLNRSEIPMGLESGFLWDLAEPRKVA